MTDDRRETLRARVHDFLENPKGMGAMCVQAVIFALIISAVALAAVEELYGETAAEYARVIDPMNKLILIVFTADYLIRVATAPRTLRYVRQPLNMVDLVSILPSYIEIILHLSLDYTTMGLRGLRVIRFLRFARVLRGLRILNFVKRFRGVFQYEGTILQVITPMIIIGVAFKGAIWLLESRNLWFSNPNLGDLFTIIGFALGIILSQKIGVSYDKYVRVEEATVRIYGSLQTLRLVVNGFRPGAGTRVCREWVEGFLTILEDTDSDNYSLQSFNDRLYETIAECERIVPDQFWTLHAQLCSDASFCLNKKVRLTPKAYDTLLHQATVVYFALIAVFIPGFMGMISVIVATYILYGMYHLTQDLDTIVGGEYNLISIDLSELKHYAAACRLEERTEPP